MVRGRLRGLALLSKYNAVLFGLGLAIWLLLAQRHWLGRWQAWAGGLLALLLFSPVIRWNAAHGWASFAKQGGRAGTGEAGFGLALRWIGELIGGQAGLATPLVFLLCLAGAAAAARRWRDPAALLLAALTLPGAVLFLWQATGSRVQGNWPAVLYPAAAIAAAALLGAPFGCAAHAGAGAGRGDDGAGLCAGGRGRPVPLPRRNDPTLARLGGWDTFARRWRKRPAAGRGLVLRRRNTSSPPAWPSACRPP